MSGAWPTGNRYLGLPLSDVRVLDMSTLLPGPLATLLLAEAGADVLKVERPGIGDEMRSYTPKLGESSANFALLNRGKHSVAADLKDPSGKARIFALACEADVLVEQFRPGVMKRLGLGYAEISEANPGLVYCSITGYGQNGPDAQRAAHDLNYMAESGLLDLVRDEEGNPPLPPVLAADIAGGAYPAVINVMLALRAREATGHGTHLDIAMRANLGTLAYWVQATHAASGAWPRPGGELVTGGSPRYRIYGTADGRTSRRLRSKINSGDASATSSTCQSTSATTVLAPRRPLLQWRTEYVIGRHASGALFSGTRMSVVPSWLLRQRLSRQRKTTGSPEKVMTFRRCPYLSLRPSARVGAPHLIRHLARGSRDRRKHHERHG